MKSRLSYKRRLLLPGYDCEYQLWLALPPHALPALVDAIVTQLIPDDLLKGSIADNVKGRDHLNWFGTQPKGRSAPDDELLAIKGETFPTDEDLEHGIGEPFEVRVSTTFNSFKGNHHIHHTLATERVGQLPPFLETRDLGWVAPLLLEQVRIGLDLYKSHYISFLGFTPTVNETLLLGAHAERLDLRIQSEGLKSRKALPLQAHNLWRNLKAVFAKVCDFDLEQDFLKQRDSVES